jgi:hypothetical protein
MENRVDQQHLPQFAGQMRINTRAENLRRAVDLAPSRDADIRLENVSREGT